MANLTLRAFVIQLSGVIHDNILQRQRKGEERKGAAGASAIIKLQRPPKAQRARLIWHPKA